MTEWPPIMTAADIAAASGGKISPTDTRLPRLIEGATQAIRLMCGWHITPVITETMVLDGTGGPVMQVPSGRILKVDRVRVEGAPREFDWSQAGMIELRDGCFPSRFRSVEVTLTHGHAYAPDVAAIVTQAILGAAASPMGATREQAGQVAISWSRTGLALTMEDRAMLAPYILQNWA